MGIGNNTTWGIVRVVGGVPDTLMVLHPDDRRRAIQFTSHASAEMYARKLQKGEPLANRASYYVVEIRA